MLVAALDTATSTLSCALVDLGPGAPPRLVRGLVERAPARPASAPPRTPATPPPVTPSGGHGGRLPGALASLLEEAGLALEAVEGFAVGLGPGSFTGLRIGLATWKGLAYASRRPIAGASSLAAMALAAALRAPASPAGEPRVLVPLLDARKGEVYAGFYRVSGAGVEPVAPEAAIGPAALVERVAGRLDAVAFGEGREAYAGALGGLASLDGAPATPGALEVAALASRTLLGAAYDAQALFALEPHYVRASEAEVKFPRGLIPTYTSPPPGAGSPPAGKDRG